MLTFSPNRCTERHFTCIVTFDEYSLMFGFGFWFVSIFVFAPELDFCFSFLSISLKVGADDVLYCQILLCCC